jgi:hypothetical protein
VRGRRVFKGGAVCAELRWGLVRGQPGRPVPALRARLLDLLVLLDLPLLPAHPPALPILLPPILPRLNLPTIQLLPTLLPRLPGLLPHGHQLHQVCECQAGDGRGLCRWVRDGVLSG